MRDRERTTTIAYLFEVRSIFIAIVMVVCRFVEIIFGIGPVPFICAILGPIVECGCAATNPGVVVERAAATQYLSASIWFLDSSVLRPIDHGSFVLPIIFAATQLKGTSWSGDFRDLGRIAGLISSSKPWREIRCHARKSRHTCDQLQ